MMVGEYNLYCALVCSPPSPHQGLNSSLAPTPLSSIRALLVETTDREEAMAKWIRSEGDTFLHEALPCLIDHSGVFSRLKQLEEENRQLRSQLTHVKSQLKKANIKGKKLARGWFLSVRNMFSFSGQFNNVAILNYFGAEDVVNDDIKAAFANIYGAAQVLESKSTRLETKLEKIRRRS